MNLEADSIYIIREFAANFENPAMLYSIGKDSSVLLHLIMKAFYPAKPPFPIVHIDTTWKFKEMIEFRNNTAKELGLDLVIYTNQEGVEKNITPFNTDASVYTTTMKTDALKQILNERGFDGAVGGARRDEEKSRAKERVFSHRSAGHKWDPKKQRPEFWNHYNTLLKQDDTMRVFPLSNWTEMDIWRYIEQESIPIVPLYFAKKRPVVKRNNTWLMVDDERFVFNEGEVVEERVVRFRTLGCYPLTGAIESEAKTVKEIIKELEESNMSERQGRLIDQDSGSASMEKKKKEGYF